MEAFKCFFQEHLPKYLETLPIPSTTGEIAALTVGQCLQLVPFTLFLVLVVCLFLVPLFVCACRSCSKKKVLSSPNMNITVDRKKPVVSACAWVIQFASMLSGPCVCMEGPGGIYTRNCNYIMHMTLALFLLLSLPLWVCNRLNIDLPVFCIAVMCMHFHVVFWTYIYSGWKQ